jgi:hypothetical protein
MYRREPPALLEAKARAFTAMRAYQKAGGTRLELWRLFLSVLDDTTEATREGSA